ncbi:protein of unknown function [Azospirillum baldaniorum]|uniref:Uncharacterized protein n=1 Tax=Azospirillum baldaniorum TaxID=1064539 RepID=A0A9P1JTF5_9PROT|nr:protein of unknown function [Azospirillum baldaniorum]
MPHTLRTPDRMAARMGNAKAHMFCDKLKDWSAAKGRPCGEIRGTPPKTSLRKKLASHSHHGRRAPAGGEGDFATLPVQNLNALRGHTVSSVACRR